MRFWVREFLGWLFLILGLGLIALCIMFVNSRLVVQGSIMAFVGVMVFRAGVHFLKVAIAARIYMDTRHAGSAQAASEPSSVRPRTVAYRRDAARSEFTPSSQKRPVSPSL